MWWRIAASVEELSLIRVMIRLPRGDQSLDVAKWGKRDPVIPLQAGYAPQWAISGSRLEQLDAEHVVFASKPDYFLDFVDAFIRVS
jgi:pimeloyl-ACP methyl ester carboxylesterase